jgi:Acylphosphatases
MVTKKIIVRGKVQGVFYRQSTRNKARALGVKGTVRNLEDGQTVEIYATGTTEQLSALMDWCQVGPPQAVVNAVEVSDEPLKVYDDFSII